MVLRIEGALPEGSNVYVSCGTETKLIDSIDRQVEFTIPDSSTVEVTIEQKSSTKNYSFAWILLFVLTFLIQGVFHILLMDIDSAWYKSVRAYNIKVTFSVPATGNMSIRFRLLETNYIEEDSIWKHPKFSMEPSIPFCIAFNANPQSISNEYASYMKRLISVAMVLLFVFIFLLCVAASRGLILVTSMIIGLLLGELALLFWLILKEYRRYQTILNYFEKSIIDENK